MDQNDGPAELRYTVQPGDLASGLTGLAQRFYGDSSRWFELYSVNRYVIGSDPTLLRAGQHLAVPAPIVRGADVRVYRVLPGDEHTGLRGIAARVYGDAERWSELYAVNRGVIGDDPQHLQPGQQLVVA